MASISNAQLTITRDKPKKLSKVKVTCKVHFTAIEQCMMKQCPEGTHFRLRCSLWGDDLFYDDSLYTLGVINYPPGNSSAVFEVTLGDGVLDEDFGKDEIYAKLQLTNLTSGATAVKKTNVVSGWF